MGKLIEIVIPKEGKGVKLRVNKRLKQVNAKTIQKLKKSLEKEGLKVTVV